MSKHVLWIAVGLLGGAVSCESSPAAVPVWVHIAPDRVQPSTATMVEMQAGLALEFRAKDAIQVSPANLPVYYHWFADDGNTWGLPELQVLQACALAQANCAVPVCDLPWVASGYVRVRLVVASRKLASNAKDILDFPEGTALDTADWLVHIHGCH